MKVQVAKTPRWVENFFQYLKEGNTLYRLGYMLPLLKCISKSEAEYVLCKIHEGCTAAIYA
jgi:hypothetical protein